MQGPDLWNAVYDEILVYRCPKTVSSPDNVGGAAAVIVARDQQTIQTFLNGVTKRVQISQMAAFNNQIRIKQAVRYFG